MKKVLCLFAGLIFTGIGCFSPGSGYGVSDSECLYKCNKCGQKALMMNSTLRSQACPEGGTHEWRYNR